MRCPHCNQTNPSEARFCSACGQRLATAVCAACGKSNTAASQFCNGCGHTLTGVSAPEEAHSRSYTPAHLAATMLSSRSAMEGERKLATVLFCDIVNSTALAARVGAEAMHGILNRFFELALAEVHRYEGTVNQFLGDGLMALFGAPRAHEDHARRAALAALSIQRLVHDRFSQLLDVGEPLELRMGLNTGLVVLGSIGDNLRRDYTAVGDTTNVAARLQQHAEPGVILVSDATAGLLAGYMRMESAGSLQVKGRTEPVAVHTILGLGPRRSPLERWSRPRLSPFVDREPQLEILRGILARMEDGHGQVVGIAAEAGMGKSRLLYEFRRSVGAKRLTYLEGRCLSYAKAIPYLPILDIIRNNCGVAEIDTQEIIREKVVAGLEEIGMRAEESAPYVLHLLGVKPGTEEIETLSPQAIKARTFETLSQMAQRGSRHRPIIFAVEDLHWIDATSEEYLGKLVQVLTAAQIMLVCTYRSGYRPPWANHSSVTQINLAALSQEASLSIVQSVLESETVHQEVAQIILGKAEGNPFFLEEFAQAARGEGGVQRVMAVPNTVQGVLMARIDQLPDETRRGLQTAAVLGREFSRRVLREIWDGTSDLEQHLLELKQQEFVDERLETGDPVYIFRHALTQDVAYESLLESRRKVIHAAAGRAFEALHADKVDDALDRLAYHFARAGEARKAADYLIRAADKAARVYANADAIKALEEALGLAQQLPDDSRDATIGSIVLRLAHSLYFLGRNADSLDLLSRHHENIERVGPSLTGAYYFWLGHAHTYLGNQEEARRCAGRAIEQAARLGDPTIAAKAHYVLSRANFWSGRFRQGMEDGRRAVSLLERTDERWWLGQSHWVVAANFYLFGEFEAALAALDRCDDVGAAIGDPRLRTYAAWTAGAIHTTVGEWQLALRACQLGLERSPDPVNTHAAVGFLGAAHVEGEQADQAIPLLTTATEQMRRFGFLQLQAWFQAWLTDAYRLSNKLEAAASTAAEAVQAATQARFQFGLGLSHRALGRTVQAQGALAEAEAQLQLAYTHFSEVNARFEVARTRLDLSLLAHAQGRPVEAREHLSDAHTRFLELRVPRYAARAEILAPTLGLTL